MFEQDTTQHKIISATLQLAETKPWLDISLGDIAAKSGIPLFELRQTYPAKAQILAAFSKEIDNEIIKRFPTPSAEVSRDRLFDVIMTRFELLQPYRHALRHITKGLTSDLGAGLSQLKPAMKSQYWMLAASGISGEGTRGLLRVKGLLALYSHVFQVWLDDEDPGLARTMAVLDNRLRRAEIAINRIRNVRNTVRDLFDRMQGRNNFADRPYTTDQPVTDSQSYSV